jgi:hypothetical protein
MQLSEEDRAIAPKNLYRSKIFLLMDALISFFIYNNTFFIRFYGTKRVSAPFVVLWVAQPSLTVVENKIALG